ncbi:hypothetical protein LGT39_09450 [Demequina sp. TTPB684]|uniref:hypothetical protein n=1 Tax=unclassified Demequina TaxID=2620311 RepID=UPI001CF51D58|nr:MULTISPECIES: hypothetical protein [unclassified Demequina]MCB2413066.1 hypothetical protein [Demequina sp. TTPB684]UPU88126.1 hypothetical protein LGT36_012890 [Demequina sp. TMPB413]
MGFLTKLLSGSSDRGDGSTTGDGEAQTCMVCYAELDEDSDDMEEGMCAACAETEPGAKYCCGAIYEEGETSCQSCGDPL